MLKEIFRIMLKKICQWLLIILLAPFMLICWGATRIKLFLEEASKKEIKEEKEFSIEF